MKPTRQHQLKEVERLIRPATKSTAKSKKQKMAVGPERHSLSI
jgi:hypothetical protein